MLTEREGGALRGFKPYMMDHDAARVLANRLGRFRRHWRWILIGTFLSGLAALVISLFLPKTYHATTYVLVSESKIGAATQNSPWQYNLLPTYVTFIDNDELIARAIEHFHLNLPPYALTLQRFRRMRYLDVQIPKSTRLLEIDVEFQDARLASDLANFFAQSAVDFNDQMNAGDTLATQKFLKQRLDQAEAHLAEMEKRRLHVRMQARIEDKEKGISMLLGQKEDVSTQFEKLRIALAESEGRAKPLERALAGEPRILQLKKSVISDPFLKSATEKLGPDAQGGLTASEEVVNATHTDLQRELADANASAAEGRAGLQTAATTLAEIDRQIRRELADFIQSRSEVEKAERDFSLAREAFESASRDYRNASVTVSAKTQDLKQVAPALPPERPTRPSIVLNTLLALLLGLALLSGIALGIESFREMQSQALRFVAEDEPVDVHRS